MKPIIIHISEAIKSVDQHIVDMLKMIADCSSGVQQELFKQKVKDADSVDIVPLSEVFSEDEIKHIKRYVRPKMKECYQNAWRFCDIMQGNKDHDVKYCEGYLNMKGIPIEHAFNKVDGKYVDITIELALNNDVTKDTYVVIGEWDTDTVRDVLLENGYYGNIYETLFLNKYKENINHAK